MSRLKTVLLTPIAAFVLLLALGLLALDQLIWRLTGRSIIDWIFKRLYSRSLSDQSNSRVDKVQRDFSAGPLR